MKSIVIKEEYIRANGLPESLINACRVVRKETKTSYKISAQGGGYRDVPKEAVQYISPTEYVHTEEVTIPSNVAALVAAAENAYGSSFMHSAFLPGRTLEVVDFSMEQVETKDGLVSHLFYVVSYKSAKLRIPAWCCISLPVQEFDPNNVDGFVKKMGLESFVKATEGFCRIAKIKQDGTFLTEDTFNGERRFTLRRKVGKAGQLKYVSKFGEFETAPEVI